MPRNQGADELVLHDCKLSFCWARIITSESALVGLALARSQSALNLASPPLRLATNALHSRNAHKLAELVERRLVSDLNLSEIPVHLSGTQFQILVWQQLRNIPYGATVSYREVAHAIKRPNAIRAVANACAGNTIALAIPCHRVVRHNGEHGGFRWGAELKHEILEHERSETLTVACKMGDRDERLI